MNDASTNHWPADAKEALLQVEKELPDGCGGCIHARWGAFARSHDSDGVLHPWFLGFVACRAGISLRTRDGELQPLVLCTSWNEVLSENGITDSHPAVVAGCIEAAKPSYPPPLPRS